MELDFFWIAIGLAAFGYFIGDGLKNFKNPTSSTASMLDVEEEYKLVKQSDLHWFIGISKDDAKKLVDEHPDIPHITIDGNTYYPKEQLKKWLLNVGEKK